MIYFMHIPQCSALKVGLSNDPQRRLREAGTFSPHPVYLLGTIPGAEERERVLHEQFRDYHLRGEWFRDDPAVLRAVALLLLNESGRSSVADELQRRRRCRAGLRGVLVGLASLPDSIFAVWGDRWDAGGNLLLALGFPDRPREGPCDGLEAVLAENCLLLGYWPAPCPCWLPEGSDE
jgi:Meiotically up-regulated gene 113